MVVKLYLRLSLPGKIQTPNALTDNFPQEFGNMKYYSYFCTENKEVIRNGAVGVLQNVHLGGYLDRCQ